MSEFMEALGHLESLLTLVVPELWRAVPAGVLALVAFGFRRLTKRFLGIFTSIERLNDTMREHLLRSEMSFKANDEAHKTIITSLTDRLARIEHLVEEQSRRIDTIVGQRES